MENKFDTDPRVDPIVLLRIAANMRQRRKQLGMSVRQLSLASGVPFEVIRDLEMNALTDIDILTVAHLSDALRCNLLA